MHDRQQMLADIDRELRYTRHFIGRDKLSDPVRKALQNVPRDLFVPEAMRGAAYDNHPLPIGEGQTISQPFIVAVMTELLDLGADDKVLEIGTGTGYQTAILAELVDHVYSIEIIQKLAAQAASRLRMLGYDNVDIRTDDGGRGWPEAAPFDAIIVTAAAPYTPYTLLEQLKAGGHLIAPVDSGRNQELVLFRKHSDGSCETQRILPVAFVPLTGLARQRAEQRT